MNIRFIIGENDIQNIDFFINKIGRYSYTQLTPEAKKELFPDINPQSNVGNFITIQFLFSEDVNKYV